MGLGRPALPSHLIETRVVAIARASTTENVFAAVEAIVKAGITCVELALTSPGAVSCIAGLVTRFGDDVCVGAGTVLTPDDAAKCVDAGAEFLVAPSLVPEVVAKAIGLGIPCLPGALTPSEIVSAWSSGAGAVKLFPASAAGVSYVRDIRQPLPGIPLVPTGGVALEHVSGYLRAGAVAVGLGKPLFGNVLEPGADTDDLAALAERARQLKAVVRQVRADGGK